MIGEPDKLSGSQAGRTDNQDRRAAGTAASLLSQPLPVWNQSLEV